MAKKKNYLHVKPVGQLDPFACWAACLKWWLKAVRSIKKSQRKLIDRYNHLTDPDGAITDGGIELLIVDHNMYIETYDNAREFTADVIKSLLKFGPLFVAYTDTTMQQKHVNIIYDVEGSGNGARVSVMEPQAVDNGDWTYKGRHEKKPISDFNRLGYVLLGYN